VAEVTRKPGLSTTAIHGGAAPGAPGMGISAPLVQSVNFARKPERAKGCSTPVREHPRTLNGFSDVWHSLEGSEKRWCCRADEAHTACAMLALLRSGDHLVSSSWIYGGTRKLYTEDLVGMGIEVTARESARAARVAESSQENTRAIFLESPVNPTCRVLELELAPESCAQRRHRPRCRFDVCEPGQPSVPSSTGVDVVIHSATKYLNGHQRHPCRRRMRKRAVHRRGSPEDDGLGPGPDPFACWLLERGLKTLDVRVKRQNENAMQIADGARSDPRSRRCIIPDFRVIRITRSRSRSSTDAGYAGDRDQGAGPAAMRFAQALKLFAYAGQPRGCRPLVIEPRYSSRAHVVRRSAPESEFPRLPQMSIGIENVEDLIA